MARASIRTPNKDPFQDYDIVYFVRKRRTLPPQHDVVRYFGEIMILQTPEDMSDPPAEGDGHYTYLMQFMDGNQNRSEFLRLEPDRCDPQDSLSLVLLDKDNLLGELPPPSDVGYLPQPANRQGLRRLLQ